MGDFEPRGERVEMRAGNTTPSSRGSERWSDKAYLASLLCVFSSGAGAYYGLLAKNNLVLGVSVVGAAVGFGLKAATSRIHKHSMT